MNTSYWKGIKRYPNGYGIVYRYECGLYEMCAIKHEGDSWRLIKLLNWNNLTVMASRKEYNTITSWVQSLPKTTYKLGE